MSEQKRKIILAIALALISVSLLAEASYLLFLPSQEAAESGTVPIPEPTWIPEFEITVDVASSKGFNLTIMEDINREVRTLFVLPPGETGIVPVTVSSTGEKSYNISLAVDLTTVDLREQVVESHGVRCTFSPTTLPLKAGEHAESILKIEADKNASTAFYDPIISGYEGEGSIGVSGLPFLVANYTPAYMYQVLISPMGYPMPVPTSVPTPSPNKPSFELDSGRKVAVMFYIVNYLQESVNLNVTAPTGFNSEILPNPLDIPVPAPDKMYLLTITADPNLPKNSYETKVAGITSALIFERSFYIVIK